MEYGNGAVGSLDVGDNVAELLRRARAIARRVRRDAAAMLRRLGGDVGPGDQDPPPDPPLY